jgi:hypothetical protein
MDDVPCLGDTAMREAPFQALPLSHHVIAEYGGLLAIIGRLREPSVIFLDIG